MKYKVVSYIDTSLPAPVIDSFVIPATSNYCLTDRWYEDKTGISPLENHIKRFVADVELRGKHATINRRRNNEQRNRGEITGNSFPRKGVKKTNKKVVSAGIRKRRK